MLETAVSFFVDFAFLKIDMPLKCCVQKCNAKYGEAKTSFHRFPAISTYRDSLRRELWRKAVSVNAQCINRSFVCGRHFVTGILKILY